VAAPAQLTYSSAFAGIEGFGLGFDAAGMKPVSQIEINPHRRKVLEDHWPNVPKGDDVKSASGRDLGGPDVCVAGVPCKDISIGKGKRKGLDGSRSGLYWNWLDLVEEHLRHVDEARPRWAVFENVPGLVNYKAPDGGRPTSASNGGRDMAAVLLGLESIGYGWAYKVVDSRFHGLAQRRPRVVVVAHRGGDPRPAWMVLARPPAQRSGVAPGLRAEQAGEVVALGGGSLAGGVDLEAEFARKSARPTKKAAEGGYSTWVKSAFWNVLTPNDGVRVDEKTDEATLAPVKQTHLIRQGGRVRVPTRLEWERLMGFPDGWTRAIKDDANAMYALGDSFAPPVARWLGEGLIEVSNEVPLLSSVA
jgi:DNA (cytosine-5)-methyltransferase 1